MRSIRRFLGRADLTPRDVQILRGIMTQMEWYTAGGPAEIQNSKSQIPNEFKFPNSKLKTNFFPHFLFSIFYFLRTKRA